MINCKELRIGNWVKLKSERIVSVLEVLTSTISVAASPELKILKTYSVPIGFVQPIPLTEGILLKSGFAPMSQKDKDDLDIQYTSLLVYDDSAICCYWDGVEFVFKYGLDSDLCIAACEFVHQLQNLIFSLTQKELVINF